MHVVGSKRRISSPRLKPPSAALHVPSEHRIKEKNLESEIETISATIAAARTSRGSKRRISSPRLKPIPASAARWRRAGSKRRISSPRLKHAVTGLLTLGVSFGSKRRISSPRLKRRYRITRENPFSCGSKRRISSPRLKHRITLIGTQSITTDQREESRVRD